MKAVSESVELFRRFASPACLVVVAMSHAYLVKTENLTQWKGGGFGMFSTVDAGACRVLHVRLISDGEFYKVQLPRDESFRAIWSKTKRLPSQSNLEVFSDLVAKQVWAFPKNSWVRSQDKFKRARSRQLSNGTENHNVGGLSSSLRPPMKTAMVWRPGAKEIQTIIEVDSVVLTLFSMEYSRTNKTIGLIKVKEFAAPGMSFEQIAQVTGLSLEFLVAQDR